MEPRVYEPSDGTRIVAHVVYGLHTVSILLGLMTGASIAGAFIFSWPSILAVILNYIFRGDAEGTYLESHFAWQIRTFWWYLFWNILAFVPFTFLFFTGENPDAFAGVAFGASAFCLAVVGLSWIWIVYRAIRGIITVNDNQPMYR